MEYLHHLQKEALREGHLQVVEAGQAVANTQKSSNFSSATASAQTTELVVDKRTGPRPPGGGGGGGPRPPGGGGAGGPRPPGGGGAGGPRPPGGGGGAGLLVGAFGALGAPGAGGAGGPAAARSPGTTGGAGAPDGCAGGGAAGTGVESTSRGGGGGAGPGAVPVPPALWNAICCFKYWICSSYPCDNFAMCSSSDGWAASSLSAVPGSSPVGLAAAALIASTRLSFLSSSFAYSSARLAAGLRFNFSITATRSAFSAPPPPSSCF